MHGVINNTHHEVAEHLENAARRRSLRAFGHKFNCDREKETCHNRCDGGGKGADQVNHHDRTHMRFIVHVLVRDSGHHEHKHQNRRHSL